MLDPQFTGNNGADVQCRQKWLYNAPAGNGSNSISHLRIAMVAKMGTDAPFPVHYILDASHSADSARRVARSQGISGVYRLSQRNTRLGWIGERYRPTLPGMETARRRWRAARPILLPGFVVHAIPAYLQDIARSNELMLAVLSGANCEEFFLQEPYAGRLDSRFELLSATYNEGDPQEIVKVEFDAVRDGDIIAENLWVKLSWLSYAERDASLRFRFSFGLEDYEDVAADPERQGFAASLAEALFPESAIISADSRLRDFLRDLLHTEDLMYVERIVYFNAPEGGAQFHHDVERGHLGVVYAQLSGRTAWLALSTEQLLDAIRDFVTDPAAEKAMAKTIKSRKTRTALMEIAPDRSRLSEYLNKRDCDPLEQLMNRTPAFSRHLIDRGHAYILNPGDIILLPQHDAAHCSWHAVYSLDDVPGEALSFAVRRTAD